MEPLAASGSRNGIAREIRLDSGALQAKTVAPGAARKHLPGGDSADAQRSLDAPSEELTLHSMPAANAAVVSPDVREDLLIQAAAVEDLWASARPPWLIPRGEYDVDGPAQGSREAEVATGPEVALTESTRRASNDEIPRPRVAVKFAAGPEVAVTESTRRNGNDEIPQPKAAVKFASL